MKCRLRHNAVVEGKLYPRDSILMTQCFPSVRRASVRPMIWRTGRESCSCVISRSRVSQYPGRTGYRRRTR